MNSCPSQLRCAVIEFCHAVRNNLQLELWHEAIDVFKSLPFSLILRYYPEPLQTEAGVFRQPATLTTVETDPEIEATVSRIAELLLVAYENTWEEYQFLQGWLRHDEYSLTNPLGAPYEFLWLNPYLPGLSYFSAPPIVHDELRGRLFARAGWQEGDLWAGYFNSASYKCLLKGSASSYGARTSRRRWFFPTRSWCWRGCRCLSRFARRKRPLSTWSGWGRGSLITSSSTNEPFERTKPVVAASLS